MVVRMTVRFARAWVQLYTSRIPREVRATRRAEIDSDLWDQVADGQEGGAPPLVTALEIVLRTCLGVLDDLSWCVEACQQDRGASRIERRMTMALSARQTRWMGILTVAGGAMVMLMFGVIPTVTSYFVSVGIPLPLPTRIVIGTSAVLTTYWWALAAAGTVLFLGLTRLGGMTLNRVGAAYGGDVDSKAEAMLTKLEPIMIVGLGVVVGGVSLAMFLPIFDAVSAMK